MYLRQPQPSLAPDTSERSILLFFENRDPAAHRLCSCSILFLTQKKDVQLNLQETQRLRFLSADICHEFRSRPVLSLSKTMKSDLEMNQTPEPQLEESHEDSKGEDSTPDPQAVSRSASHKGPRKRTKTGCLTCRKRRIKCGEQKYVEWRAAKAKD